VLLPPFQPYHLRCLGSRNGEFKIGIFLPVSKEKRKLGEEAIVCISGGCDCLWAGIAIQAAFQAFSGANKLLPIFKVVRVFELCAEIISRCARWEVIDE